ncbi:MAG TPA: glucosamine-6-phosphate deaminase [Flavisolibacter sp.]|jgi:galactosamine-6-phosphate isomerase|nr:glucosamine-6-phosphate deaminase [Flavisolibacter sp.]
MQLIISENYNELSRTAAEDLIHLMQGTIYPLVCTASGDTPAGLYRSLIDKIRQGEADVSRWEFVGLDEWAGMNGSDEGSCRYHLDRQFFQPLQIPDDRICFFDGRAKDPEKECARTEAVIEKHGQIELAILGLGQNGHIGMNEPGTPATLRSHYGAIAPETQEIGKKYFKDPRPITHGLTLGLANLLEAHHLFLLVSGEKKAAIVKQLLETEPTEQLPATLLLKHPGLRIYLDKEAAKQLPA